MASHPHITIPACPVCGAEEKAVGDLDHERWFCFSCGSAGVLELTLHEPDRPAQRFEGVKTE